MPCLFKFWSLFLSIFEQGYFSKRTWEGLERNYGYFFLRFAMKCSIISKSFFNKIIILIDFRNKQKDQAQREDYFFIALTGWLEIISILESDEPFIWSLLDPPHFFSACRIPKLKIVLLKTFNILFLHRNNNPTLSLSIQVANGNEINSQSFQFLIATFSEDLSLAFPKKKSWRNAILFLDESFSTD